MTSNSSKLIAGGLTAGLIALSGITSAFAVPRMSALPKVYPAQTRDDRTLAVFPAPYRGLDRLRPQGDTMQRDGGPSGGSDNPYDHAPMIH